MSSGNKEGRRLEVVVLSGRGLRRGGRWKVQLTVQSGRDPKGESFGAKVSTWTESAPNSRTVRFGAGGLRAAFPLTAAKGAPAAAMDVRFTDTAVLCVRLLGSHAATSTAARILPGAFVTEIDEATRRLEAEAKVPLTNVLSGRATSNPADRALGGWVPLRPMGTATDGDDVGTNPALWLQIYVLPDHEGILPSLQAQREGEAEAGATSPTSATSATAGATDALPPLSAPPASASTQASVAAAAATPAPQPLDLMGDLIGLMEEEPALPAATAATGAASPPAEDLLGDMAGLSFGCADTAASAPSAFTFIADGAKQESPDAAGQGLAPLLPMPAGAVAAGSVPYLGGGLNFSPAALPPPSGLGGGPSPLGLGGGSSPLGFGGGQSPMGVPLPLGYGGGQSPMGVPSPLGYGGGQSPMGVVGAGLSPLGNQSLMGFVGGASSPGTLGGASSPGTFGAFSSSPSPMGGYYGQPSGPWGGMAYGGHAQGNQ